MFEVMAELESLCAGYAAERMSAAERRALEEVHEELRVLIQSGDPQRYHEVNEAFHATIYAGAHNAYLAELTLTTRARVRPFRRAQFRILGRLAKSHVEHDRVVQAILRGERVLAAQTMHAHIITVREEYEHYTRDVVSRVPGAAQHEVVRCRPGTVAESEFERPRDRRRITSLTPVLRRVRARAHAGASAGCGA